ncbi:hypothetical protein BC829DRAFT_383792 [Chytridium lagenaria]|nr:hypothetical protein BC829DRAFT_383792 [Chytridium lagenaria]
MTLATNAEKSAAAAGATTAGANPTELPSKIKRSQLKPEIIEQLSCLAANVTLRLVGTRWRLVMQQQHLMNQHSQQHLPLNPLQQLPHHSLGFGPSTAAAAAMNSHNGMFLTIPQQHLHPLTPPQSPFKHLPTSLHPSPTQPPTPLRTTSTASVSPAESITSTTTLSNNPPLQTPQTNSHGSSPLPATYLFHYAHRLRAMVTHTLSRTRAPAQIVPYALLIVHRLVSLRTLPEPLATPTPWTAIGKAVGAGIDERKHVAALKIVALEALNWRVVFPPHEFEAWLERLKGWVAGAAAAVGIATTPTSTTSARGGVPTVSPYTVSPLIGSPAASPQNQSGTVMGHVYTPTMRAGSAPYGGGSPYAYHPYQVAFTRQASGGGFHVVSPGVVRTETRGEMVVEATDTL